MTAFSKKFRHNTMISYSFCPVCGKPLSEGIIEGRSRMVCTYCGWIHYRNPLPVAVAYTVNRHNELLVIRRAHEPAIHEWALPGGFLEEGEEPHEGCLRELMEETSLDGQVERLIGIYHRNVELYGSLLVVAYKVVVDDHERMAPNHEVSEAGFFTEYNRPQINIPLHRLIIEENRRFEALAGTPGETVPEISGSF